MSIKDNFSTFVVTSRPSTADLRQPAQTLIRLLRTPEPRTATVPDLLKESNLDFSQFQEAFDSLVSSGLVTRFKIKTDEMIALTPAGERAELPNK